MYACFVCGRACIWHVFVIVLSCIVLSCQTRDTVPGLQATSVCLGLVEAFDNVGPCCPPQWDLQDLILMDFHAHVRTAVDLFGMLAHAMSAQSILQV
jgi:hypothetical protein